MGHQPGCLSTCGVAPRTINLNGSPYEIPRDSYRKRHLRPGAWEVATKQRSRFRTHEPVRIPTNKNFARAIASCLARDYPVIMAWHVGGVSNKLRNGYALQGRGPGNHASFFHSAKYVGGEDVVHPDLCNSWGERWGDGGFRLMTMDGAAQCRKNHVFYALTGVTEDPESEFAG